MSIVALQYVKDLTESPSGEEVTLREKGILWYLADFHNAAERAAWPSVSTIAKKNNIEERAVRYILKSCIVKGIIWRDEQLRPDGSQSSNLWRFTQIDGEPPTRALIAEEKRQILGRDAAQKANQIRRRGRENPQEACEDGCKSFQQAGGTECNDGRKDVQPGDEKTCSPREESLQPMDESTCSPWVKNGAALDLVVDPAVDLAVDLAVKPLEKPLSEAQGAAAEEIPAQLIQDQYKTVWRSILDSLLWVVGEAMYLQLCVKTKLARAQKVNGLVEIDVNVPDAAYEALLVKHQAVINKTLRQMGFGIDEIRIQFAGPSVPQEVS